MTKALPPIRAAAFSFARAGVTGGPAPFVKADRSRFLQALDEAFVSLGGM